MNALSVKKQRKQLKCKNNKNVFNYELEYNIEIGNHRYVKTHCKKNIQKEECTESKKSELFF